MKLKDWVDTSCTVGPRHTLVLAQAVMGPTGAGVWEGVPELLRVMEAVMVEVGERDLEGEGVRV